MELVALLPWWAGVVLAVLSYLLLHAIADQPLESVATRPGQVGAAVAQSLWRAFASVGKYVIPLICLAGAAMSAWQRRARGQLVETVARGAGAEVLDGMSWQEFEQLVGEGFRRQGYRVAETGGGGADGGVDLVLHKDGDTVLVQCKQWRAYKVGVTVVRELYGVMAARGAAAAIVVTSGRFTVEAEEFAAGRNVRLIDGRQLHALIRSTERGVPVPHRPDGVLPPTAARGLEISPTCPACGKAMVRRTARRGSQTGNSFWGCATYPACRGTRPAN